jgi:uncharacterized protein (TIGR02588 family)
MTSDGTTAERTNPGSGRGQENDKSRSIAEWTTLAISAAILVGIVGMITWLSFRGAERPPMIVVEPDLQAVRHDDSGYYVPVVIRNDGDATVEEALVQGELDTGSGEPETVQITISFLAGGEKAQGTFVFRDDPASGELTTGVLSYQEP